VTLRTGPGANWPKSGKESFGRTRIIYDVWLQRRQ
jgi:hypothetical protein